MRGRQPVQQQGVQIKFQSRLLASCSVEEVCLKTAVVDGSLLTKAGCALRRWVVSVSGITQKVCRLVSGDEASSLSSWRQRTVLGS